MRRITARLSVVLLCIIMLSGCWDAKELDDLSIPLVASYDLIKESEKEYPDDKYLVTVGVPVFYEDVEQKFHVIETTGEMIGEARVKRSTQLGEQVILGQLQLLLIGEELGKKENLLELTDIITRNSKVKGSIFIVITKGRAVDILNKKAHGYPNIGIYLKSLMENIKNNNFYPYTTLYKFNRYLISYETAAILPHIIYRDEEIMLAGSCLINEGRIAGEMGRNETETAVLLRGIKCKGTLSFDALENGKVIDKATFEGSNSRKVNVMKKGDKYVFNISIRLKGVVVEHTALEPIEDGVDRLKLFQTSLEKHIKKRAEALIKKTQEEFKFDALCLANYMKAHTRKKLTKKDIDKIIQEAEINVEVKVDIDNVGGKM